MNYKFAVRLLVMGAALAVCSTLSFAKDAAKQKTLSLKDSAGNDVGTATIVSKGSGVELKLQLKGLPPGVHAVHFHQNAKCEAPDFKSAGPHFNPAGKQHGFENPQGHHAGDMKNFTVEGNGMAKATLKDDEVVLGSGSETNSLFANGGTAIIVHAKADDYKTDPSGNSGDRIACGAITP